MEPREQEVTVATDSAGKAQVDADHTDKQNNRKLLWNIFKLSAIPVVIFLLSVSIPEFGYFMYSIFRSFTSLIGSIILVLDFRAKMTFVYLTTLVLILAYFAILFLSISYKKEIRNHSGEKFETYESQVNDIPKKISVWVLPVISLLIVLVSQVSMLLDTSKWNFSHLSFAISTSFILLMIGMELAYHAQEHSEEHGWLKLVTVSLILDFASYFIIIVGLAPPKDYRTSPEDVPGSSGLDPGLSTVPDINPSDPNAPVILVPLVDDANGTVGILFSILKPEFLSPAFAFVLALTSLTSSYYTVTQARITDEVFSKKDK